MDIVEQCRKAKEYSLFDADVYEQAADEIERLREEVSELKKLMQATVNYAGISVSTEKYAFHALKEKPNE